MPRCRERLAELDYVVWDGRAETADDFIGKGRWDCIVLPANALRIGHFDMTEHHANVGDVILKDDAGNAFVMTAEAFARAYEAI